jgi:hypothetical protein
MLTFLGYVAFGVSLFVVSVLRDIFFPEKQKANSCSVCRRALGRPSDTSELF